jgi:hypothetical protein
MREKEPVETTKPKNFGYGAKGGSPRYGGKARVASATAWKRGTASAHGKAASEHAKAGGFARQYGEQDNADTHSNAFDIHRAEEKRIKETM